MRVVWTISRYSMFGTYVGVLAFPGTASQTLCKLTLQDFLDNGYNAKLKSGEFGYAKDEVVTPGTMKRRVREVEGGRGW